MSPEIAAACERLALSRSRLRHGLEQPAADAGIDLGSLVVSVTGELASARLRGIAQAHPYRLVLGAFAFGAGMVAFSPWRVIRLAAWSTLPAVTRALMPPLASGLARKWLAARLPDDPR